MRSFKIISNLKTFINIKKFFALFGLGSFSKPRFLQLTNVAPSPDIETIFSVHWSSS